MAKLSSEDGVARTHDQEEEEEEEEGEGKTITKRLLTT